MAASEQPPRDDLIRIAEILGAHGVRGEVKIRSFAQEPADIADYSPLVVADASRSVTISSLKPVGASAEIFVATLEGVSTRGGAEALSGQFLHVPRARLAPIGEDEFLHADLIGCRVELDDGRRVGKVVAVQNFGAGDLVEVALEGRRTTEFVSFTREQVPQVDLPLRRIVVAHDPFPARSTRRDGDGN